MTSLTFYGGVNEIEGNKMTRINSFLKYLKSDPNLDMPGPKNDQIVICKPKKSIFRSFEKDFFDQNNLVTAEDITKNMKKYFCAFNFWDFGALIDTNTNSRSFYIYSSNEPYNEEMEVDEQKIKNWLQHFGYERFQSHCSGHSKGSEILELVKEIDAKTVYSVHTEHSSIFKKVVKDKVLIDEGKNIR